MKNLKKTSLFLAVVVAILTMSVMGCKTKEEPLATWNLYKGEYAGYNVEIDESLQGDQWFRMVHLTHKNSQIDGITGHTAGLLRRDQWSSIFLCGSENVGAASKPQTTFGCNEMTLYTGNPQWNPCLGDQDTKFDLAKVNAKVAVSRRLLNEAVQAVYNRQHRVQTLESYLATHKT